MWCPLETLRDEVVQLACSVVVFSTWALQPLISVPSDLNSTVPVGEPAPGDLTAMVAVKVTDWPDWEGLSEEDRVAIETAWLTFWFRGGSTCCRHRRYRRYTRP